MTTARKTKTIPLAVLDPQTVQWFLAYLKAVKHKHNVEGRIAAASDLGRVVDDVEWNIQRGTPSTLVLMEGE